MVNPQTLLMVASLPLTLSFFPPLWSRLALIPLFPLTLMLDHAPQWVGLASGNAWGVKLQASLVDQAWCLCVALLTLLHLLRKPEARLWSCACLLGCVGLSLARDLFHMYVWLELLTLAFLGFHPRAEKGGWQVQALAATMVLWGTLLFYQASGSLTLPQAFQVSAPAAVGVWMMGWLIKGGMGFWTLKAYRLAPEDLSFIAPLMTKACLLPLLKLPATYVAWLPWIGFSQFLLGLLFIVARGVSATTHINCQTGVTLLNLSLAWAANQHFCALYLCYQVLSEFFFWTGWKKRPSPLSSLLISGLPPSPIFFLKLEMMRGADAAPLLLLSSALTLIYLFTPQAKDIESREDV